MAGHRPNGHATPYKGADGWWHCHVTVGLKPDGRPDRRHVKRKTQKSCSEAVDELRHKLRTGERTVAKAPTVAEWLDHWLANVVQPNRKWKTHSSYQTIIELHLKPRIGRYRIGGSRNLLQPEHLDACYADLRRTLAPAYVLQVHRVLSRALKVAHRRGRANRNVCDLVDAPAVVKRKPKALPMESVKKILSVAAGDRMAARWLIALLLGLRQGEALGLQWGDLDLDSDRPTLRRERQAQRRTWQHGCDDPAACAGKHCRTGPCPPAWEHGCADPDACKANPRFCPERVQRACRRHRGRSGCPGPCPPGCTRHATRCPQRTGGGIVLTTTKTERSEGVLPLDPELVRALKEHLRAQKEERLARGAGRPRDTDLVFTTEPGTPIDPRRDHEAWERVLERAGVPDAPLHAARHGAATLLVATGTDIAVVQDVLGHTDIRTTRGYTDVAEEMKREAVNRLAAVLFGGALDPLVRPPGATPSHGR